MNPLLDTVEPDGFMHGDDWIEEVYRKYKVEALLTECRKQTLLEAADKVLYTGLDCARELRRMAEGEK